MGKSLRAVITGDIVQSRQYSSDQFENILLNLKGILESVTSGADGQYEIYRGDSFQVLLSRPAIAMRAAILISLSLKCQSPHATVRQSIAIGIDNDQSSSIRTSLSHVLVESGLQLDAFKKQRLDITCVHSTHTSCLKMITRYLGHSLEQVTESQAKALFHYIRAEGKISHGDIAEIIGTSRVNVTKLLNTANYQLIEDSISLLGQLCLEV